MRIQTTLNLEKQFTFYASYHTQPINVAIHLLCIWPILATAFVFLQYTPDLISAPSCFEKLPFGHHAHINIAFVLGLIYMLSYVIMEPLVGAIAAALVAIIYLYTGHLVNTEALVLGYPIWMVSLVIHVTGWILQFIGHGAFEGRAPALLDSLDQALLTAPLFVLLEVLFFIGYRKKFHDKVMQQVRINVREFKNQQKKKK